MKKTLSIFFLIFFLWCGAAQATNYFGCASAAINADNTFCTTPTGSCTGETAVSAGTALQAGNTLYANGCAISFPDANFTAGTLSCADGDGAGAAVSGGGFTLDTATAAGNTYTTNITGGATGTACLTVSGDGAGTPVDTIVGDITGGTTNSAHGIADTHTVGTIQITGLVLAGSASTSYGYTLTGTGPTTITGNCHSGGTAEGCLVNVASGSGITVNGNCQGADTSYGAGCRSSTTTTPIIVTGNLINGLKGSASFGWVMWQPAANRNYALYPRDASYVKGTWDSHAVQGPAMDAALGATNIDAEANVKSGVNYGSQTGTMAAGGGSWGF